MTESVAYVDAGGNYLGHFDTVNAPAGATATKVNPTNGKGSVWNGSSWGYPPSPVAPLDAATLASALITKGTLSQADVTAAIAKAQPAQPVDVVASLPQS